MVSLIDHIRIIIVEKRIENLRYRAVLCQIIDVFLDIRIEALETGDK